MPSQPSFSQRQGLLAPSEIKYRDSLPRELRQPIFDILRHSVNARFLQDRCTAVLNPYGIAEWPSGPRIAVQKEEDQPETVNAKRMIFNCEWFSVFDIIEDIWARLAFHDEELAQPDEAPQASPFQQEINEYFRYAGIGWRMVDGLLVSRGDDGFEHTVRTAEIELSASGRTTAADRIRRALQNLSARPTPDFSGAISHGTGAMEMRSARHHGRDNDIR